MQHTDVNDCAGIPKQDLIIQNSLKRLVALAEDSGYEILQVNGQRLFGPPKDWSGPSPGKGCEIFIGKIPRSIYEDDLVPLFQSIGKIYRMRLMLDFSGTNRGYAFVQYTCPQDAFRAMSELNGVHIRPNCPLYVCLSIDNCRLFVGGIPRDMKLAEVRYELSQLLDDVVEVLLYMSVTDKTRNRGFAFVEFENHRAAAMARRKAYPSKLCMRGCWLNVDWAAPEPEVDPETLAQVKVLYVRNLSDMISENDIKHYFQKGLPDNSIQRVKKMKDFAFVHFCCREDAEYAMIKWNKQMLFGIEIEVQWAKPKDKLIYTSELMRNKGRKRFKYLQDTNHYEYGRPGTEHFLEPALPMYYPPNMNFEAQNRGAYNLQYSDQSCSYTSQNPTTGVKGMGVLQSGQGPAFAALGQGNIAYTYMQPTQPAFFLPTKVSDLSNLK